MDTIDTKELIESIKEIELYLKKLEKLESENKWLTIRSQVNFIKNLKKIFVTRQKDFKNVNF